MGAGLKGECSTKRVAQKSKKESMALAPTLIKQYALLQNTSAFMLLFHIISSRMPILYSSLYSSNPFALTLNTRIYDSGSN
jgi:hypothetical protein